MTNPSSQRLARLLSLVPWLSQHQGVTMSEAANHFGVSPEELEKDLWLVVCCGLPGHGPDQLIDIQFWDDDGHIDVIDPQTLVAPMRLTIEEAASLQVGLALLAALAREEDRVLISETMSALSLATSSASADAEHRDADRVGDPLNADLVTNRAIADIVAQAAADQSPVSIDYYGATRDAVSHRLIWPQRIVLSSTVAYVEAWCSTAGAKRTFRLDRIQSATRADEPDPDLRPTMDGFEMQPLERAAVEGPDDRLDPTKVSVRIHREARWVLDSYDFIPDQVQAHDRGDDVGDAAKTDWIGATILVWDVRWFVGLVCSLGGDLVVEAPCTVRSAVRQAALRGLARTE